MITAGSLSLFERARRLGATAVLASGFSGAMLWRFGWSSALPAFLLLAVVSAVVVVADLTERRIPSAVVLPAYPVAAALLARACAPDGPWWPLARAGLSAALVVACYLAIALAFPGQLGLGDLRLGGVLGGFLGFLGWSTLVSGTLLAWVLAAVTVLVARGLGRGGRGAVIPFGPFLVAGAFVAILLGS